MDFGFILQRLGNIWDLALAHPKIYFLLIGEWFLYVLYYAVTGEEHSYADVYATGVTATYVGFELLPFENMSGTSFSDPLTIFGIILLIYGLILLILAITQTLPKKLIYVFGSPAAMCIPAAIVIMHFEAEFPVDFITIMIILVPVIIMETIKLISQFVKKKNFDV